MVNINSKKMWRVIEDMCKQNHVLGGSLALLLLGYDVEREIKDIDMIYLGDPNIRYYPLNTCIIGTKEETASGSDVICTIEIKGIQLEILKHYSTQYTTILRNGINIKVLNLRDILDIKFQYALKGYLKHGKDLYKIFRRQAEDRNKSIKQVSEMYGSSNYVEREEHIEVFDFDEDDLPF